MTRTPQQRVFDVRRVQDSARAIVASPSEALVSAIVDSTGLSREGVQLALAEHVEIEADEVSLTRLVSLAGDASRVGVILSANVFVGALRAIAIARAASEDVVVRPSRRDPAFARALVDSLQRLGDRAVYIDDLLDVASFAGDELHVYGRDETILDVKARARPEVRVRGHGSGMGIAWVSRGPGAGWLDVAARALARDVVAFDQRGCLSPRIALVHGDLAETNAFADALHAELSLLESRIPRGPVPEAERIASGRYVATMTYASRALVGVTHAIGIAPEGVPLVLPPPYRHVHVAACSSVERAARLVQPLARGIVSVGSFDLDQAARLGLHAVRFSRLGLMQRPPLDGPVDPRAA